MIVIRVHIFKHVIYPGQQPKFYHRRTSIYIFGIFPNCPNVRVSTCVHGRKQPHILEQSLRHVCMSDVSTGSHLPGPKSCDVLSCTENHNILHTRNKLRTVKHLSVYTETLKYNRRVYFFNYLCRQNLIEYVWIIYRVRQPRGSKLYQ